MAAQVKVRWCWLGLLPKAVLSVTTALLKALLANAAFLGERRGSVVRSSVFVCGLSLIYA